MLHFVISQAKKTLTVCEDTDSRVCRAGQAAEAADALSPHVGDDGAAACDAGVRVLPGEDACHPAEAAYGEAGA